MFVFPLVVRGDEKLSDVEKASSVEELKALSLEQLEQASSVEGKDQEKTSPGADQKKTSGSDEEKTASVEELKALSLEQLMDIEITIASRTPERVSQTPAAVTVLSGEDIQRSGVTTLPDVLRLVPGLDVAQVDSHSWAISSRGFNETVFANKLLVMIDGRTVYTPLFAGVYWAVQDVVIEEIERIEVVRGPGTTLWGANAVNGVINIVTKNAKDTQGVLVSGGGGTLTKAIGEVQYGFKINENTFGRVYAKYFNQGDLVLPNGNEGNDKWEQTRGGFRIDSEPNGVNLFTLQGDYYGGNQNDIQTITTTAAPFAQVVPTVSDISGGDLLGRWTRAFSEDAGMTLQAYYDYTSRDLPTLEEKRHTADLDFQSEFVVGERHKILWGLGYRHTHDDVDNTLTVRLDPASRGLNLFSSFVQDEITAVPEKLAFTVGSKFEHNDFTGFEVQPNVRLLWTPREEQTIWFSVTRAVRTPSRGEEDVRIEPSGVPPGAVTIFGNRDLESEKMIAYEMGHRFVPKAWLSVDIATFYNVYDDLVAITPLTSAAIGPSMAQNNLEGDTYGVELANTFRIAEWWRLNTGYTFLQIQLHSKLSRLPSSAETNIEDSSPQNQFFARSSFDFGRKRDYGREFKADAILRYVDSITVTGTPVPSYATVDLRLAWRFQKNWELALVGRNLADSPHPEYARSLLTSQANEIPPSFFGKLTWKF